MLIAAEHGHFAICKLLIQHGAAVRKNTVHTGYHNAGTTSALIRSIEGFSAYRPRSPKPGVPEPVGFTQTLNRDIKLAEAGNSGNRNADCVCKTPEGNYADKEAGLTQTIHDSLRPRFGCSYRVHRRICHEPTDTRCEVGAS